MIRVIGGGVIGLVARITVRRQSGVVVVHVALGARHLRVETRQGERRGVVVETRRDPGRRVVANVTLLRESGSDVIGAGGGLKIFQMAGDTRSVGQLVIVVDVALIALHGGMKASKRPARSGVIELCSQPRCSAVAH